MKKLKAAFIFLCLVLFNIAFSQTAQIDSLNKLFSLSNEDTGRVLLYSHLSGEYSNIDPEKALAIGQSGFSLAKKLHFRKGEALCINKIGVIYYNKGIYEKAVEYYLTALKINEEINNKLGISDNLCNLGAVYRIQKKYKEGLECQFRALKLDEELKNRAAIAGDQTNVGNIYYDAENYSMALKYYMKGLKAFEELSDKQNSATTMNNIAAIHFSKGDFDKAENIFSKALKIYESEGDKLGIAMGLNNLGQIYLNKNDLNRAMEYCKKSLAIAVEIDAKDIQQYNYENLAEITSKMKDFKQAYEYHKLYSNITGSLLNAETSKQINEMAIKYESEKKEKENLILKRQTTQQNFLNAKQKKVANYLIAGLIIVAGIGFVFYKRGRIKEKANERLEKIVLERTSELEFKNKQKELMLQEIHHRVKNNLQLITSMLRMQRHFKGTKNVDEILDVCADRIKCMAILHDKLYQAKDFSEINAQDYFTELAGYVSKNYDGQATIEMDIIPVNLHINKLIPCGLILNELVSNAYKYAFLKEINNNSINISFTRNDQDGSYQLKIKDNGSGLPREFDINNQGGLGLTIVQSLVEQLDGKINFQNNEGVLVNISFPS